MASLPEVYRTCCLLCATPFVVTSLDEDGQCSGECPKCGGSVMSEPERVEIELEQQQEDIQQPWPAELPVEQIECRVCAAPFDPTDFAQVMWHEHKGLTAHPAMQKMLTDIPPGELLGKMGTPPYMAPEQPTCPYCGCTAQLTRIHYGEVWACRPCDARVGCHKGTQKPLGTLANAELRRARRRVHELFDPLWKEGGWPRPAAYAWLGQQLQLEPDACHVARFDLKQVDQAEELLRGLAPGYPHAPPCPCEGECAPCPACGYCECEWPCSCAAYGHGGTQPKGPCWREP